MQKNPPFLAFRNHKLIVALVAIFAVIVTLVVAPTFGAAAAESSIANMRLEKTVNGEEEFTVTQNPDAPSSVQVTYAIDVMCDDAGCVNATMTDPMPPALEGFKIVNVGVDLPAGQFERTYEGCGQPGSLISGPDCVIGVKFLVPLADGDGVGLNAGQTTKVSVTVEIPAALPFTWPHNGEKAVNTATSVWDNAMNPGPNGKGSVSDTAALTVVIPETVDFSLTKNWTPASQQFKPGDASTITINAKNASNVGATTLTIQEPTTALDGASALATDNPFRLVNLSSLTAPLPSGADTVTVEVYVFNPAAGTWSWLAGTPGPEATLPDGIDAADVGGLRLTYAGESIAPGASTSIALNVAQRETIRETTTPLHSGANVTNHVSGELAIPTNPASPLKREAEAPYEIRPLTIDVTANKSFEPRSIPAGTQSKLRLSASNNSNGPIDELRLSETNFFTDKVRFDGFSALTWPQGATNGTIIWHMLDGSAPVSVALTAGTMPTPPAGVSGFELVYTGAIAVGASVTATAGVTPSVDLVTPTGKPVKLPNTLTATGKNAVGEATKTPTDTLTVNFPTTEVSLSKRIRPDAAVSPGGSVVATLTATTTSTDSSVNPTKISIEDAWQKSDKNNFWNAFDLKSIAPTQIPANTTTKVRIFKNGAWLELYDLPAQASSRIFSVASNELNAALMDKFGFGLSEVEGIAFDFLNNDPFASGTSIIPNLGFTARAQLRDGSGATSVLNEGATTYKNSAIARAHADVEGLPNGVDKETNPAVSDGKIETIGDGGADFIRADKKWVDVNNRNVDVDSVEAQSGKQVATNNGWLVATPGHSQVVLTDAAVDATGTPLSADRTVYQAFNLVTIDSNADPLLKWDTISTVELYNGSAWVVIPAPGGSWMNNGTFKGYNLSAEEQLSTIGVRLTVVENSAARAASNDPERPDVNSGVASSPIGAYRSWPLTWELRNTLRVPTPNTKWATADTLFASSGEEGAVRNTFSVEATKDGTVTKREAADDILLTNAPPLVRTSKSVTTSLGKNEIDVPESGDVDPQSYPTVTYTVKTWNNAVARASYLRAVDPVWSASSTDAVSGPDQWAADPFTSATYDADTNPYESLRITRLQFATPDGSVIDKNASRVWLWKFDGTTATYSVAEAEALTEDALKDVVGVGATYQSANPAETGGLIPQGESHAVTLTIATKVLQYERSDATVLVGTQRDSISNKTLSQSYDPVMYPGKNWTNPANPATPFDDATVRTPFRSGALKITGSKTIPTNYFLEVMGAVPFTVNLGATTEGSTVATHKVTLSDSTPEFWNLVELNADAPIAYAAAPVGSDQVELSAYVDGAWVSGGVHPLVLTDDGAVDTASLVWPAELNMAAVTGVRVQYSRADGHALSQAYPVPAVSTQLTLNVTLLTVQRDGAPVSYPTPAKKITNVVDVSSERTDDYPKATGTARADITLDRGQAWLDVGKHAPVSPTKVGDPLPWTLEFENAGNAFIDLKTVVDELPANLEWDFSDPIIEVETKNPDLFDGPLVTADATVSVNDAGNLVFTWPEGTRMRMGDTVKITLNLALMPGLGANDKATNKFRVVTDTTLDSCTNFIVPGRGTLPGLPNTECGTSNFVQPQSGGALLSAKRVNGDILGELVDGQTNMRSSSTCPVDAEGFTRQPCASHTIVGGTDEYKLDVVNSGTFPFTSLVIADPLPYVGDKMLSTGAPRGSMFRSVFDGEFGIKSSTVPAGTTVLKQVTTDHAPCIGTGSPVWPTDQTCESVAWTNIDAFTGDWADVTGLRIKLDFTTTAAKALPAGGAVQFRYRTYNAPAAEEGSTLAPIDSTVTSAVSWNQMSAQATYDEGSRSRTTAATPIPAGVLLQTGSLQIEKELTVEEGSRDVAAAFDFDVSCTVAGAAVRLPNNGIVTVSADTDYKAVVTGLPLGASCDVAERGDVGTYGEDERAGGGETVRIVTPSSADGVVPAAQTRVFENIYKQMQGALDVTKLVTTEPSSRQPADSFDVQVSCVWREAPVELADGGLLTLNADNEYTARVSNIPVGSDCVVAETGEVGAYGESERVGDGQHVTITAEARDEVAAVTIENIYRTQLGAIDVVKKVTAAPSSRQPADSFDAQVSCTWQDAPLELADGGLVTLNAENNFTARVSNIPVDSACVVNEVGELGTYGEDTRIGDGQQVIITADHVTSPAVVTIENIYGTLYGALDVTKKISFTAEPGETADQFDFTVSCVFNGAPVELPNGGVVTVTPSELTARIAGIPVGSLCTISEEGYVGWYGESERSGDGQTVTIAAEYVESAEEPAVTGVTVENVYNTDPFPPNPGGNNGGNPTPSGNCPDGSPNTSGGCDLAVTGQDQSMVTLYAALALLIAGAIALTLGRARIRRN